ncbi:hypothetical protein LTR70_000524 [Exophiala xenobiotica]|nr:hypothetical protein LTR70_000524 [Exophiala xenobiotica]
MSDASPDTIHAETCHPNTMLLRSIFATPSSVQRAPSDKRKIHIEALKRQLKDVHAQLRIAKKIGKLRSEKENAENEAGKLRRECDETRSKHLNSYVGNNRLKKEAGSDVADEADTEAGGPRGERGGSNHEYGQVKSVASTSPYEERADGRTAVRLCTRDDAAKGSVGHVLL